MPIQTFHDEYLFCVSNHLMWFQPVGAHPGMYTTVREAILYADEHGLTLRMYPPEVRSELPLEQIRRMAAKFREPPMPGLGIRHTRFWQAA